MDDVLISTKGQIVLPIAVRKALGLKPGMRVNVKLDGKRALLTPAKAKTKSSLQAIQLLLKYPYMIFNDRQVKRKPVFVLSSALFP